MSTPMSPERFAEIVTAVRNDDESSDYYLGGYTSAGLALELADEIERLRADYRGGDQEAQARAWSAVYQECERLGMLHRLDGWCGRDRVLGFVRHLASEVERLRAENERLRGAGRAGA